MGAVRDQSRAREGGNRPGEGRGASDPPRATIAVLDDDPLFRRGIVRVLRSEGFDVVEADDVRTLADVFRRNPVDLVVADSRLADGSDGWAEARALAEAHGDVPVVPMTGYDADAIAAVGGITDVAFVQKSGTGFGVVAAVERALARR